jgi:hypothetical protein
MAPASRAIPRSSDDGKIGALEKIDRHTLYLLCHPSRLVNARAQCPEHSCLRILGKKTGTDPESRQVGVLTSDESRIPLSPIRRRISPTGKSICLYIYLRGAAAAR